MKLREKYNQKVTPLLKKKFDLSNDLAVCQIEKIVLNVGLSDFKNKALRKQIEQDLEVITGQKPSPRQARISIAGFKIRQGQEIGLMVTLRGQKMWDFLERLIGVALPRVRDFRGLPPSSLDGQGNLTIGIVESMVFPEINPEHSPANFGLGVTIVTSSRGSVSREMSQELFKELGFPIQDGT